VAGTIISTSRDSRRQPYSPLRLAISFSVRGDHRTAKLYVVCSPAVVTVQNSAEIQLKMLCGEGSMHGAGKWEISPNSLFFKCVGRNDLSELVE
jgi:hypothetical protein